MGQLPFSQEGLDSWGRLPWLFHRPVSSHFVFFFQEGRSFFSPSPFLYIGMMKFFLIFPCPPYYYTQLPNWARVSANGLFVRGYHLLCVQQTLSVPYSLTKCQDTCTSQCEQIFSLFFYIILFFLFTLTFSLGSLHFCLILLSLLLPHLFIHLL